MEAHTISTTPEVCNPSILGMIKERKGVSKMEDQNDTFQR